MPPKGEVIFDKIVNDPEKFDIFAVELIAFCIAGIIFGALVDFPFVKLTNYVKTKYENDAVTLKVIRFGILLLHFISIIIVLYAMMKLTIQSSLYRHWQNTIPGLGFPAFFFGIQTNIFSTVTSLYT